MFKILYLSLILFAPILANQGDIFSNSKPIEPIKSIQLVVVDSSLTHWQVALKVFFK